LSPWTTFTYNKGVKATVKVFDAEAFAVPSEDTGTILFVNVGVIFMHPLEVTALFHTI